MPTTFNFSLPFCLYIPDGDYQVKLPDGTIVALNLKKAIPKCYDERMGVRGLMEQDLAEATHVHIMVTESDYPPPLARAYDVNEIWSVKEFADLSYVSTPNGNKKPNVEVILNGEILNDRNGRFRFTAVKATIDRTQDTFLDVLKATNRLIEWYRFATQNYWVHDITERDVIAFFTDDGEGSINYLHKFRPDAEKRVVDLLKGALMTDQRIPIYETLLLDAENAKDEGKNAISVVYFMTALESIVKKYVDKQSSKEKLSKASLKYLKKRAGLHKLVTCFVRSKIDRKELEDQTVKQFEISNELRNDIIHESVFEVSPKDAEDALNVSRKITDVLIKRVEK